MKTYNLYISDFYVDDLRPGQFLATPIMDDISHDHSRLPIYDFSNVSAVRSCDVIKGHQNVFANSFAQKRATATCMGSLCSAHQAALNDIHFDLEVTLRSRDLRSPLDLDLMRSYYIFRCVSTRGSRWCSQFCSSSFSSKVIGKKLPCSQEPLF